MSQSASFQGFPLAVSALVNTDGSMTMPWYRFFQYMWRQVSAGTPADVTLGNVNQNAMDAQQSANNAVNSVAAESERAQAAEAALQGEINTNANNIATLQGQVATLQSQVVTLQGQTSSLQTQINTINGRLANAGIP